MRTLLTLVCAVTLTGCATNPFTQFYQSYTNGMPLAMQQQLLPASARPQILSVTPDDHKDEARRLEERSFVCIGFSGFRGGAPNHSQLVEQAKKVGADVVLHTSQYSHTEQGVSPVLSYQPGQTYTTTHYGTANASAFGSGGYAYGQGSYSGTSTTTTPSTYRTDYVPYQRAVYEHGASYWRHIKLGIFGARFSPIPDELRSSLQRNTGAFVQVVMLDSPAFRANIMRGDVIIELAGRHIQTFQEIIDLLPSYAGQEVSVRLIRGTQTIDLKVQLGHSI